MIRNQTQGPTPLPAPPADAEAASDSDIKSLFRTGLWGGAAALCLLVAAMATRTEVGQSRMTAAYAALTGANEATQTRSSAREAEIVARRTADAISSLTEDRDRLLARMTALERNYEDVTGSIGRLSNAAKAPGAPAPIAAPSPELPPLSSAPASAPPVASAPAAAPPTASAVAAPEPEPVPTRTEFGVDIGGAPSLAALRTAWERIRRNHASLLDGLRPVIAVRESRSGQVELRLVVGPIGNAAAAAKLCAALAGAGLSCQPTMFDGQRLALR
jgi:hypothetical protein